MSFLTGRTTATSVNIAAGSITASEIADDAITTAKIAAGAVGLTEASDALKAYDIPFRFGYASDGTEQAVAVQEFGWAVLTRDVTFVGIDLNAETAPTGANLIVDIRVNGSTIFSTLPEIDDGTTVEDGNQVFSTTTASAGSLVTAHVTQIGSTITGSGLTATVRARQT